MSLLVHRLSPGYRRTAGASYSTTMPHSQSHAARCPPHVAPSRKPLLTHRPIHHGVPPRGEVGGSGWPDPIHRNGAHSKRPGSGQINTRVFVCMSTLTSAFVYMSTHVCICFQESWYEFRVMAVMDDLISESSNVVGVSSTGGCIYKENLHSLSVFHNVFNCVVLFVFLLLRVPKQTPSLLQNCPKRAWRGRWWQALWRRSVFWQQQYCSAL